MVDALLGLLLALTHTRVYRAREVDGGTHADALLFMLVGGILGGEQHEVLVRSEAACALYSVKGLVVADGLRNLLLGRGSIVFHQIVVIGVYTSHKGGLLRLSVINSQKVI